VFTTAVFAALTAGVALAATLVELIAT